MTVVTKAASWSRLRSSDDAANRARGIRVVGRVAHRTSSGGTISSRQDADARARKPDKDKIEQVAGWSGVGTIGS